jgi:hypothetical protein
MHPPVLLVRAAHHDPARLIRDSPLQRLHFVGELRNVSARAADVTDREAATYWSGAA